VTDLSDITRRSFVALTTTTYDDARLAPLPGIADEVAELTSWLCDSDSLGGRAFIQTHLELAGKPTLRTP
jgi:hypothetical protein